MMQQIQQLLEKFWENQISLSELKELYFLLSKHKEELSNAADVNIDQVEQAVADRLSAAQSEAMLSNIHTRLGLTKKPRRVHRMNNGVWKWAAAAALVGTILFGVRFLNTTKNGEDDKVQVAKADNRQLQTITNKTSANKNIELEDGSLVDMAPNAAISYYQPFSSNLRDVSLTGTAFFTIAKDKARPFTVYANHIATTALGTQFWVYANDRAYTSVHLVEGKVVVRGIGSAAVAINEVFLAPGEAFSFDGVNNKVAVNKQAGNPAGKAGNPAGKAAVDKVGDKKTSSELVFVNQPVAKVFRKIEQVYGQSLLFNDADLKGLSFTGTFLPTDNIQVVLSSICIMNDLSFEKDGKRYKIAKRN